MRTRTSWACKEGKTPSPVSVECRGSVQALLIFDGDVDDQPTLVAVRSWRRGLRLNTPHQQ